MFKNFPVIVDTVQKSKLNNIVVNSNDLKTFKLTITINQFNKPIDLTGATVRIAIVKPDNKTVFQDCTITDPTTGICEVVLDTQAFIIAGVYIAEVMIYFGVDTVAVTGRFSYSVSKGILDNSTVESTNDWQAINQAIDAAEGILIDLRENGTGIDVQARSELETVTTQLADTVNSKVEVVNIKEQFSAVAGAADNTQSFLNAATYAKANGMALYLPKGNYACTSDVIIDGVKHIIFDGTVTLATGKVLDISYDSYIAPCNWKITNVAGGLLRLSGLNSSKIEIIKAKELELYAHGDIPKKEFMAYNTFTLGKIDTFRLFSEGVKDGWINENKFFGGRISNITFDGNFHHDNNIFYGTMLEGFTMTINRGISNFFYDVRMEGTNSITFGPGTSDNVIYRSWIENPNMYLRDTSGVAFTNNGFNNQVVSNLDIFHKKEVVYNVDSRSNNYPLSAFTKNQNDLTVESSGKVFYETDLIELNNPIGLVLKSDKSLFYISAYAYDANKVLLTTQQTNFIGMAGFAFYSGTGAYTFDTNVGISNTGVPLFPNGIVKYIKYRVRTGDGVTGQSFNYLKLIKIESNVHQTTMKVISPIKQWTHTTIPTKGYWEVTDEPVYNTASTAGGKIGWKCLTTGTLTSVTWAATTAYTVGQKVSTNGKVYEVTIAGTSGSTAPSHTTGTATDGTVTWKYLSPLGLLKPFGAIDA